jgi:hypothetical protein
MPTQHERLNALETWREETADPCLSELRKQLDDVQRFAVDDQRLRELEAKRIELAEKATAIAIERVAIVEQTVAIHDRRVRALARMVGRRKRTR